MLRCLLLYPVPCTLSLSPPVLEWQVLRCPLLYSLQLYSLQLRSWLPLEWRVLRCLLLYPALYPAVPCCCTLLLYPWLPQPPALALAALRPSARRLHMYVYMHMPLALAALRPSASCQHVAVLHQTRLHGCVLPTSHEFLARPPPSEWRAPDWPGLDWTGPNWTALDSTGLDWARLDSTPSLSR